MIAGHLQIKNDYYYMVLSYLDANGKRKQPWFPTEPTNGKVYVFVGKTRKVMKLLHWERGGYVMYYKRLETGRLSPRLFPSCQQVGFRQIRWDELVLFIEGISPGARRRKRFQVSENSGEDNIKKKGKSVSKVWLTR